MSNNMLLLVLTWYHGWAITGTCETAACGMMVEPINLDSLTWITHWPGVCVCRSSLARLLLEAPALARSVPPRLLPRPTLHTRLHQPPVQTPRRLPSWCQVAENPAAMFAAPKEQF
jgi:hypothetical protein